MSETTDTPRGLTLSDLHSRTTLNVEEAGRVLGIGRSGAYDAVRRGDVPSLRIGGRVRVPVPALLRMLGAEPDRTEMTEV